uniref:HPr family phosphocarrier protein n=1 Tax=Acidicaldus sp. TaxID=1872105 RepID=A0A8J4M570_9PROT
MAAADEAATPRPACPAGAPPAPPPAPSPTRAPSPTPIGVEEGPSAEPVLTRRVQIRNRRGLHARAAARFVTLAERFGAAIDVVRDGQSVSARSIMGLMMLGAGQGTEIELRAEGWDAQQALEALAALIEAGFDEQD